MDKNVGVSKNSKTIKKSHLSASASEGVVLFSSYYRCGKTEAIRQWKAANPKLVVVTV